MKTVALLTNRLFDWDSKKAAIGGGERYTMDLARLMVGSGFKVDIFQPSLMPSYSLVIEPGISLHCLRPEIEHGYPEMWMSNEFYRRTPSYDLHLVTIPEYMCGNVHKGTILTVQGCAWFDKGVSELTRFEEKKVVSFFEKASVVTTIHGYVKQAMRNIGFDGEVAVINHGIDTDIFTPKGSSGRKRVLFPGRAEVSKGTELYKNLLMTKEYADKVGPKSKTLKWEYAWCGDGSERDNVPNRFSTSLDAMAPVYRDSEIVCVFNMVARGNSLVLLEAMASGKACIAFDRVQDAITDREDGLTAKKDVADVHCKILELINNKQLRKRLGARARETILDRYSIDSWKSRWSDILGGLNG